ncbi:MAG: TPM domain-containing protein [Spirochaetes bacterium]|nr:TPM domain-containing protein [Spirochaetota bacterium]
MKKIIPLLALIFVFIHCQSKVKDPLKNLNPAGFVNDFAGILSEDNKKMTESLITRFEQKTGVEIAVVTLPALGDYSVEEAAVRIFEQWGIGKKGQDNGLLLLIALKERKVRIEVGYGLEGMIPDSVAGRILDVYGMEHFKQNDFNTGVTRVVSAVIARISQQMGISFGTGDQNDNVVEEKQQRRLPLVPLLILMIFLFRFGFWWIWPMLLSGGGYRHYGGGSFGGGGGFSGGFGGFGGGFSGGGGASRGF